MAPLPRSLVRAPLSILGDESGLPPLGDYHVLLLRSGLSGEATEVLAGHVIETFRGMR